MDGVGVKKPIKKCCSGNHLALHHTDIFTALGIISQTQ